MAVSVFPPAFQSDPLPDSRVSGAGHRGGVRRERSDRYFLEEHRTPPCLSSTRYRNAADQSAVGRSAPEGRPPCFTGAKSESCAKVVRAAGFRDQWRNGNALSDEC